MNKFNRKLLWITKIEERTGLRPLDFKMARYLETTQVRNRDDLMEALATKIVVGIGENTLNKLKVLVGIQPPKKRHTWKAEAQRLYKLLDQHGLEYTKCKVGC